MTGFNKLKGEFIHPQLIQQFQYEVDHSRALLNIMDKTGGEGTIRAIANSLISLCELQGHMIEAVVEYIERQGNSA